MAWERRRGGNRYYYSAKRVGSRITKRYLGCGELASLVAWMDQNDTERRQFSRDMERRRESWDKARYQERTAMARAFTDHIDRIVREAFTAAGYRQHHRGEWRKARGTAIMATAVATTEASALTTRTTEDKCWAILEEAKKKNTKAARAEIRKTLAMMQNPPLTEFSQIARQGLVGLFNTRNPQNVYTEECILAEADRVARRAIGPTPTPLEALQGERIAMAWLEVQATENNYVCSLNDSQPVKAILLHQRRAHAANRRYESALKTLAQIRRLQIPTVNVALPGSHQINVGEKQVIIGRTA